MLPKIEKILYATALDSGAPFVCRYALAQADKHDAKIIALHVIEPLSRFGQSLVELHLTQEQSEQMHTAARATVKTQTEEKLSKLLEVETGRSGIGNSRIEAVEVVEGQPSYKILERAREIGADLIVIGSHRRSMIGDALLGHTASKITQRSEIPVMLVRIPEGFEKA